MIAHPFACLAACLLAACSFDTSGIALRDSGADMDGDPIDGAPSADARDCPSDVELVLSIGGISDELPSDTPYVHALPGDIVELSAVGSCGRAALTYEWQISPIDATRATAAPDLTSETITIYPVLPQDYTVTLTVRSDNASATRSVLGVRTYGWQRRDALPGSPDVRGLAVGSGNLWIAHAAGAHRLVLGGDVTQDLFIDVAAETTGDPIANDLGAAHYNVSDDSLWLGQQARRDDVWRVTLGGGQPVATAVNYSNAGALGGAAEVFEIATLSAGVGLATDRGLTTSPDGTAFMGAFTPPDGTDVRAVVEGDGQLWVGSRRLYRVNMGGAAFDPFPGAAGADARIRSLAIDAAHRELWVASDGNGVARVDISGVPSALGLYDSSGPLGSNRVRDVWVETTGGFAGDVWAATSSGVARYLRGRDTWLLMGNSHGLQQRTNVATVIVDSDTGRRVIFAGTRAGLVSLGAP